LAEEALGLRPYEEVAASTGGGPNTGLLAGSPVGKSDTSLLTYAGAPPTGFNTTGPGFQSTEYPERARRREEENRERQGLPAVPPTVAAPPEPTPVLKEAPPADPWAGRVQIFGSGAEGFGTDTSAQWLARWPSQARAEQKPGTDNWYLPVGVTR
jgi:hypothetical protein